MRARAKVRAKRLEEGLLRRRNSLVACKGRARTLQRTIDRLYPRLNTLSDLEHRELAEAESKHAKVESSARCLEHTIYYEEEWLRRTCDELTASEPNSR
jgi:hypothetical protein